MAEADDSVAKGTSPDTDESAVPPAATDAYLSGGIRARAPTEHAVDGVGGGWSVGYEFGPKSDNFRIGGSLEIGEASCAGCAPLALHWTTLSGGIRGGLDLARFGGWGGLTTTVGATYMLAGLNPNYNFTKSIWMPSVHVALWVSDRRALSRIELDFGVEEWLAVGDRSLAVGVRLGLMRLLNL
jgi:hypothetical protein